MSTSATAVSTEAVPAAPSLIHWRTYRQLPGKSELFGSDESLRWFIRCYEAELVERGAVIRHRNRPLVVPHIFDALLLEIGAREAKAHIARKAEQETA